MRINQPEKVNIILRVDTIVLRRRDTKESTCLLRRIMTEKPDLCQYAVCITRITTLKKATSIEWL